MLTQTPAAVSVSHPKLLDDVGVWLFYARGPRSEDIYTVGSVTADRYLTVPASKLPAVRAFMNQLTGRQNLREIHDAMVREHGVEIDVESLHRKFQRAGLLSDMGGTQAGDIQEMSATFVRLPMNRLLHWLRKASPLAVPMACFGFLLLLTALALVVSRPAMLRQVWGQPGAGIAQLGSTGLILLIGALSVFLHEMSHCFVASQFGILAGTVRIQLYLGVIPIVALKLSGLYTLPPRARLAVWSAGVYTNLVIASAALLLLRTVAPGSHALELTLTINWFLAVFNLMPLLPTDGYFVLCTLVKDSNVRVRAWNWLRRPFRAGRKRPSLFVLAYMAATVWLLLSTLFHLIVRIVNSGIQHPKWQAAASLAMLGLFLVTLWRSFRRTEESE